MNILIVSEGAYPESFGGSQSCFHLIEKHFAVQGHSIIHLTACENKQLPVQEQIDGVDFRRFYISSKNRWLSVMLLGIKVKKAIAQLLTENSIDLVLVHHVFSGYSCLSSVKKRGIPIAYYFHSAWSDEFSIRTTHEKTAGLIRNRIAKIIVKNIQAALLNESDIRIVESDYMRSKAIQVSGKLSERDIFKIVPGINVDLFKPSDNREALRKQLGIPENTVLIFTARRLVPRMGLDRLVAAMVYVRQSRPNAVLWIAGDGPVRRGLEDLVEKLSLRSHVRLLGRISQEKLLQCYQSADLFVLPTIDHEGFGLVTVEALACGTPVIGTDSGGTSEILRPFESRLLVSESNELIIAEKIKEWIADMSLSHDMRIRSREYAERAFDCRNWLRLLEEKLTILVTKSHSLPSK